MSVKKRFLYQELSYDLQAQIKEGRLKPGDRLPSIRKLCDSRGISKSTVLSAYGYLESIGLIEAQPRSAYVVRAILDYNHQPKTRKARSLSKPSLVRSDQFVVSLMEEGAAFDVLPGKIKEEDNNDLRQCLSRAFRSQTSQEQSYYDAPQGMDELRLEISRYHQRQGSFLEPEDITITSGCQNALMIALLAVTRPGDIVAVESPCFYGAIQLIEALGLRIVEIPSVAELGIDLSSAQRAFEKWDVKVLMLSPNFSTPSGILLDDTLKMRLLSLCGDNNITIIEDDIYGDLSFSPVRPRPLYSYDSSADVMLCSSFSKSLSRDLRIGWLVSNRHQEAIRRLKIATSLAASQTQQVALTDYLKKGLFDRYLKKRRIRLATQCAELQTLLEEYLPDGQLWSTPKGGLSVWYELPKSVDTSKLYLTALNKGIVITPGALFSSKKHFNQFLRMSFGHEWIPERRRALQELGKLVGN